VFEAWFPGPRREMNYDGKANVFWVGALHDVQRKESVREDGELNTGRSLI
jgi:hypothetical protein